MTEPEASPTPETPAKTPGPRLSRALHPIIMHCYQEAYTAAIHYRFESAHEWGRRGGSLIDEADLLDQRQALDADQTPEDR